MVNGVCMCVCVYVCVDGFPHGAPPSSCSLLFPKHEGIQQEQQLPAPYEIVVSSANYTADQLLQGRRSPRLSGAFLLCWIQYLVVPMRHQISFLGFHNNLHKQAVHIGAQSTRPRPNSDSRPPPTGTRPSNQLGLGLTNSASVMDT